MRPFGATPRAGFPGPRRERTLGGALSLLALVLAIASCAPGRGRSELDIELPVDTPEGVRVSWQRVNGADSYRLVFARMTGAPICTLRVDATRWPAYLRSEERRVGKECRL